MCFVELICCHTFLINIFGKSYVNNYYKTALNRNFDVEILQIRALNSKISLIFEVFNFADFLSYLTPAPFLWRGSRLNRQGVGVGGSVAHKVCTKFSSQDITYIQRTELREGVGGSVLQTHPLFSSRESNLVVQYYLSRRGTS